MARIGIVEDDHVQAEILDTVLDAAGHQCTIFRSALEFRRGIARLALDAVILDWMLPDEPGVNVVSWVRASPYANLPVIMLTMLDSEADVLQAFAAGADDYIVKPASPPILVARVSAQLRRAGAADAAASLRFPPFVVDPKGRTITLDGVEVSLTEKEFDLAFCLFRRANLMVSRDLILREVWRVHEGVETRSLDTYLSRLRRRLGLDGSSGWRLRTIYQHGYRLEQVGESPPSVAEAS